MLITDLDLLESASLRYSDSVVGGADGSTVLSSLTSNKGGFVSVDVDGQNVLYKDLSSLIPGETFSQSLTTASGLPASFSLLRAGDGSQSLLTVGNGVATSTKTLAY